MRNLEDYVSLIVDATVKSGISRQVEAFKSGFNQVSHFILIIYFNNNLFGCVIFTVTMLLPNIFVSFTFVSSKG
jgi:hypothetical protein